MRFQAVLFDLDGTLIDSHGLIIAAFRHACRVVLGCDLSEKEAQTRWGEPLPVRFAGLAPEAAPALIEAYAAYYDRHESEIAAVFPGVREMLRALAAGGCRLGVVTSKRRQAATQALRVFDLAACIAAAVGAEDAAAPKPAPDPVREALRRLATSPDAALMVGDGVFDIQAARAAGVRSAAALWGTREAEALVCCGPDYLAKSPGEVVDLAGSP